MNAPCLLQQPVEEIIILSMCLLLLFIPPPLVTYVDEDADEILELSSNKTFLVVLKVPEECATEEGLPHLLTERVIIS